MEMVCMETRNSSSPCKYRSKAGSYGPEKEGNLQEAEENVLAPVQSPDAEFREVHQGHKQDLAQGVYAN